MSSINRTRTRTPSRTRGTRASNAAAATTAATPATTTSAASTTAPVPSGAGQVASGNKVAVNGFGGKRPSMPTNAVRRFAADTNFNNYVADGKGAVDRGFIKVDAEPLANGCRINVDTFHKTKNDTITLFLMAEVLDTKTKQMRTITLGILCENEKINGKTYRGSRSFDLSYDDVNKWLKARNPTLKLNPGHTPLSVAARFKSGHQAGGPGRGGAFRTPFPTGAQNATATRIGALSGVRGEDTDLPLDMQVGYSKQLIRSFPMLKTGGSIVSRLESEFKGTTDKQDMTRAVTQMYALVEDIHNGDRSVVDAVLGKDWGIETVSRYWLKDDGTNGSEGKAGTGFFKGFRVDDAGLPIQDPMKDQYMDDKNLSMTQHEGAIRLRTNKQATFINIKPGGGRIDDKTGIRQRVEVGVELKKDASVKDAGRFLQGVAGNGKYSNTVYNHAQREVRKFDPNIKLAESLNPFMEVTQDRHKFTLKNEKTGVEIEFSFDFVKAKTTRPEHANADGTPQEIEFCVLEGELDHLQLQSANASSFQAAGASSSSFRDDSGQDTWLKSTGKNVTMDVDPRLHEVNDLKNKSFRETDSYAAFEVANEKMMAHVFPKGLKPGKQKAAHAATLLSLIVTDAKSMKKAVKRQFAGMGVKWTPTLEKAVTKQLKSEDGLKEMNRAFQQFDTARDVKSYLKALLGVSRTPAANYDDAAVLRLVKAKADEAGLTLTTEVKALIKKIDPKKLDPIRLHRELNGSFTLDRTDFFSVVARAAGHRGAAPKPGLSATKMLAAYASKLDDGWVNAGEHDVLKKYISAAYKKGAPLQNIRKALENAGGNDYYFNLIGQQAGITPPTISADPTQVLLAAKGHLEAQGVLMSAELEAFFKDFAVATTPSKAKSMVGALTRTDFRKYIERAAKTMGVPTPAIQLDWAAIDATMQTAATAANVRMESGLKGFIKKAIEGGVTANVVENFIGRLWAQNPKSAQRSTSLKLPTGVDLPAPKFFAADLKAALGEAMDTAFLDGDDKLMDFSRALVTDGGNPPGKVALTLQYARTSDLAAAMKRAKVTLPTGTTAPKVKYDAALYLDHLRTTNGSTMGKVTPELAKFVTKAFVKAQNDPAFNMTRLKKGTAKNLAKKLAALSGLTVPPGI